MRPVVVTRTVLALSGLLFGASLGFAWLAGRGPSEAAASMPPPTGEAGDPALGERLFALRCAACHDIDDLVQTLAAEPELGSAAERMQAFLASHGNASAAEDRAIVAALRRLAAARR